VSLTAHDIVIHPVISEKSMDEAQRGKYTFAVHRDANKVQIAAAVGELFKSRYWRERLTTKTKEKRGGCAAAASAAERPLAQGDRDSGPGQKIEFFEAV